MLFIGPIVRKLMSNDDQRNNYPRPTAYPAVVGVPMAAMPCNCRGDPYCPQCCHRQQQQQPMMPMMAAAPIMSHRDAKREWRSERRAMRGARRAARHGYGYDYSHAYPAATVVPVVAPPMGGGRHHAGGYGYDGHDDDYRAAGPSSRARPEQRPANYWEDDGFGMPGSSSTAQRRRGTKMERRSSFDEEEGEDLPPKYEQGDWSHSQRSTGAPTQGKRSH